MMVVVVVVVANQQEQVKEEEEEEEEEAIEMWSLTSRWIGKGGPSKPRANPTRSFTTL